VRTWLVLLLLAGPALAAQPVAPRLDAIRAAFLRNDASALAQQFPAKDRVYVALPRFETGAFLGPGPLRALLGRLTRETRTTDFTFIEPERAIAAAASGDVVFLKAHWTYRTSDSQAARSDEIYLSVRRQPEDGEWRIVELKASR
jgi:ketosteroid isomerase-like protein